MSIDCIRSSGSEPRFVSIPSMNFARFCCKIYWCTCKRQQSVPSSIFSFVRPAAAARSLLGVTPLLLLLIKIRIKNILRRKMNEPGLGACGLLPGVGPSVTLSSRKTPSESSFKTCISTQVARALTAAFRLTEPDRRTSSSTVHTSVTGLVPSCSFEYSLTLLREEFNECRFQGRHVSFQCPVFELEFKMNPAKMW